jgi:hypothetical protein
MTTGSADDSTVAVVVVDVDDSSTAATTLKFLIGTEVVEAVETSTDSVDDSIAAVVLGSDLTASTTGALDAGEEAATSARASALDTMEKLEAVEVSEEVVGSMVTSAKMLGSTKFSMTAGSVVVSAAVDSVAGSAAMDSVARDSVAAASVVTASVVAASVVAASVAISSVEADSVAEPLALSTVSCAAKAAPTPGATWLIGGLNPGLH